MSELLKNLCIFSLGCTLGVIIMCIVQVGAQADRQSGINKEEK